MIIVHINFVLLFYLLLMYYYYYHTYSYLIVVTLNSITIVHTIIVLFLVLMDVLL